MAPPTQSRLTYDDVENDYNNAINKVSYYSDRMHSLASVKSDTFSTALNYFSSFLGLKDGQDLITKYSGVVILAAGMILPELGLAAALVKSEAKLAQLEELLKMAEKLEKVTERAKSVVEKIGSFREHRELKKGLQEDSDLSEQRERAKSGFETSLHLVAEKNANLKKIDNMMDEARETANGFRAYYKHSISKYSPGALLNYINNALGDMDIEISDEDIEQIALSYAYALIRGYCEKQVKKVKVMPSNSNWSSFYEIDGLNEEQKEFMVKTFGMSVRRSKYFLAQYIIDADKTLFTWNLQEVSRVKFMPPVLRH